MLFFIIVIFAVQILPVHWLNKLDVSALLCFYYALFQGKTVGHLPLSACVTFRMT